MNKQRRKYLAEAVEKLSEAMSIVEDVRNDEQDAFDNMPGSLQYSERGEQMEEYIDNLDEAYDNISDVADTLQEIIDG